MNNRMLPPETRYAYESYEAAFADLSPDAAALYAASYEKIEDSGEPSRIMQFDLDLSPTDSMEIYRQLGEITSKVMTLRSEGGITHYVPLAISVVESFDEDAQPIACSLMFPPRLYATE